MTRSSIVAAVVVTALLAILLWWRGERGPLEHTTEALNPRTGARARAPGEVVAVSSARPVSTTAASAAAPLVAPTPVAAPTATRVGEGRTTLSSDGTSDAGAARSP